MAEEKCALYLISCSVDYKTICITDPSATGELERIVCFLSNSFYGGTDIGPAFDRACKALDEKDFVNADVLMVSDFLTPPLSQHSKAKINFAKQNGTLFDALEIGASGRVDILYLMDSHYCSTRTLEKVR